MRRNTQILSIIILFLAIISCTSNIQENINEPFANNPVIDETAVDETIEEKPQLQVSNTFHYMKEIGTSQWYYITGVLTNVGDKPIKYVRAKVTYYLADGTEKYYDNVIVWPSRLEPGQKGAFAYQAGQVKIPNQFDVGKYKVEPASFQIDENKAVKDIEVTGKRWDDTNTYFIANVKNSGERTLTSYGANIITYDSKGHVLSSSPSLLIPSSLKELKPDQTAEFSSVITHPSKTVRTVNFDIEFDYSAVK